MKRALRLLGYLLVLWAAATANFLLPRVLPGDPVEFLVGEEASRLSLQQQQAVLAQFGLERPLLTQYGRYLSSIARFDLGFSVTHGMPVTAVIAARLPWTLFLVGTALLLAFVLGFALAALFHMLGSGRVALLAGVIAIGSLPPFWIGMVSIAIFAAQLGWLPSHGAIAPAVEDAAALESVLRHALLPVATLTLAYLPPVFLLARAGLADALNSAYVALARALGARPWVVLLRHAAPNALLPLVNQLAIGFGGLLGGTVVVESVFAYPGMGLALYEGILAHDFPLVQAVFLLLVVVVVLANLAADAVQALLDPRLRAGEGRWA